ncbi:MAG: M48 family metalloprotease [Deltaproteobacteria bacterium]
MANSKQAQQAKQVAAAFQPMTADDEKELGRDVAAKVVGHYHIYNDASLMEYVNLVGATVAAQAPPRQGIEYHFAVLDSDWVNAFSTPGGYIFITRGALAHCDDESELAGVLGHEVAHITGKHVVNIVENDRKKRVGKEVGSDYAQKGPGLVKYFAEVGVGLATNALFKDGLPADDEFYADKNGVIYAHAAGYPADGLERFLAKMDQANKGGESVMQHTHPPVADRNARIQQEIASNNWQDKDRPKLAERFAMAVAALKPKS